MSAQMRRTGGYRDLPECGPQTVTDRSARARLIGGRVWGHENRHGTDMSPHRDQTMTSRRHELQRHQRLCPVAAVVEMLRVLVRNAGPISYWFGSIHLLLEGLGVLSCILIEHSIFSDISSLIVLACHDRKSAHLLERLIYVTWFALESRFQMALVICAFPDVGMQKKRVGVVCGPSPAWQTPRYLLSPAEIG